MMDTVMLELDAHDQALMQSFQYLRPLLQASSRYIRAKDDEPASKRTKQEDSASQLEEGTVETQNVQKATLHLLRLMGTLLLHHERQLQQVQRQDTLILFIQPGQQGPLPHLEKLAQEWKELQAKSQDQPPQLNLRTYMLRGLLKEVYLRIQNMASSKKGEELWDRAVERGVLLPDGAWPYQKWDPTAKKLVRSHRAPMQMSRTLHQFAHLDELLATNDQLVRFQSLRPQESTVPWIIQLSLRQDDVHRILSDLTQNTLWSLYGLSLKAHSQNLSHQAQTLQSLLQSSAGKGSKGKGKGKNHSKSQRQR